MLAFGPVGHLGLLFFLVNHSLCAVSPLLGGEKLMQPSLCYSCWLGIVNRSQINLALHRKDNEIIHPPTTANYSKSNNYKVALLQLPQGENERKMFH